MSAVPLPRVLVTRPAPEAARWAAELSARGIAAEPLALIDIGPEPMQGELAEARLRLGEWHAAMFVSGNAVSGFFQQNEALAPIHQAQAAIVLIAYSTVRPSARAYS